MHKANPENSRSRSTADCVFEYLPYKTKKGQLEKINKIMMLTHPKTTGSVAFHDNLCRIVKKQ